MKTSYTHAFIFITSLIISTYILKALLRLFPRSKILNYVVSIALHLKWGWDCLLSQSFSQVVVPYELCDVSSRHASSPEIGVRIFEANESSPEPVECAVCLCKVEGGEEVGDLRCDHIFHRACLDRWLGTGHQTCPLCRAHVKSSSSAIRFVEDVNGYREVIEFDFFSDRRDRCTWWLR